LHPVPTEAGTHDDVFRTTNASVRRYDDANAYPIME